MRYTKSPYNFPWLIRLALFHRSVLGITSHLTTSERVVLYRLAYQFGGDGVLEVGSYLGASASALAAGLVDAGSTAEVVCVDTWLNDTMSEGSRDTWAEFGENTAPFRGTLRPFRGRSREVAGRIASELARPLSLVFFDGDHSYEGVRQDWETYRPLMANGAVVAFHDIGWAEGVKRLVTEMVEPRAVWTDRLPNLFWAKLNNEP